MITLTAEQEKLVAQAVESGAYDSPGAALNEALHLLQAQNQWLRENKAEINAKIERAMAQLDRGEGLSPEQLRAALDQRKQEWLARQAE